MYYVYAIKSISKNYIYVGITDNIDRRFYQHNSGKNKTTAAYIPYKLLFTEEYNTRPEARLREIYLKGGSGKEYIKQNCLQ